MLAYLRPWIAALRAWLRVRSDHAYEVAALRQQLAIYERRRPDVRDSDRLFWALLVRPWGGKMSRGPLVLVMEAAQDGSALHSAKSRPPLR